MRLVMPLMLIEIRGHH